MKTILYFLAFIFGLTVTAQDSKTLKRKGELTTERQALKTDIQSISAVQTSKLNKFLNLSDTQLTLVNELISEHLKSEKYADLLSKLTNNTMSKSVQKQEGFDQLSAELFTDEAFASDLNKTLNDQQRESFKQLVNKFLTPR